MTELVVGDFAGGIYWHDTGPAGTVRDAVNALADDDGSLFRRGGVRQMGPYTMPSTMLGLTVADLIGGQRVLVWDSTKLRLLDDSFISAYDLSSSPPPRCAKPAFVGPFLCLPQIGSKVTVYAGAVQNGSFSYGTGTIATVAGQSGIVGTGTNFASTPPGAMLFTTGSARLRTAHTPTVQGVVQSVGDATHLTLDSEMDSTDTGLTYALYTVREVARPPDLGAGQITLAAVAGRLVVLAGSRASFSAVDDPFAFGKLNFHQLESAASTLGAVGLGGALVWFASDGVWMVENMAVDLVGADGTIQQTLHQVSKDMVLWGAPERGGACGVVGWEGQLVVPAIDDVYVMGSGGSKVSIGAGIRPLLQYYVAAGCWPGTAEVFNGHYLLPVLDDTGALVDMLVCRLAARAAWTHWDTLGRQRALAVRSHRASQRPELLGVQGSHVYRVTGAFNPSSVVPDDEGGQAFALDVTTHDVELGPGNLNTVQRVRARYDLDSDSAAQVTASYVIEGTQTDLVPVGDSDGYQAASWWLSPVRRARRVRLRVRSSGSAATMRLRSLALTVRPSSRSS